jgi:hypothetical protein
LMAVGRWDVGDPDVDVFVDANIVSFAAWDLVIYLNRNPGTCESLARLAGVLARQESDMLPAVRRLVDTTVLVEVYESSDADHETPPRTIRRRGTSSPGSSRWRPGASIASSSSEGSSGT